MSIPERACVVKGGLCGFFRLGVVLFFASSTEFVGGFCPECSESHGFSGVLRGFRNQRKCVSDSGVSIKRNTTRTLAQHYMNDSPLTCEIARNSGRFLHPFTCPAMPPKIQGSGAKPQEVHFSPTNSVEEPRSRGCNQLELAGETPCQDGLQWEK